MRSESVAQPSTLNDSNPIHGQLPDSDLQSSDGGVPDVKPDVEQRVNTLKGGGSPLPETERAFFEERMSADFSQVRVHTGSEAVQTARDLGARAYTTGPDIVFNDKEYMPGTSSGRRLLAQN
jgi:hypothetical protein